jgi:hypothetical protein
LNWAEETEESKEDDSLKADCLKAIRQCLKLDKLKALHPEIFDFLQKLFKEKSKQLDFEENPLPQVDGLMAHKDHKEAKEYYYNI